MRLLKFGYEILEKNEKTEKVSKNDKELKKN